MPQITKTREVSSGCYVMVQFTCPPELQRWDGHLFQFMRQASTLHFNENAHLKPEHFFPDGEVCYNRVTKRIEGHVCVFEFFLISNRRDDLTFEMLKGGRLPPNVEVLFP